MSSCFHEQAACVRALQAGGGRAALESRGTTFSWREPFFLRLRGKAATFSGSAPYAILRHRGESPATAHVLHPHLAVDPLLPAGQKLGISDQCFFRADRQARFSGEAYLDRFELHNRARVGAKIDLFIDPDPSLPPLSSDAGDAPLLAVSHTGGGPETVFIILRRDVVNDIKFAMLWDSPLTYLRLDESLRLAVEPLLLDDHSHNVAYTNRKPVLVRSGSRPHRSQARTVTPIASGKPRGDSLPCSVSG
jgi:hypothetical protein